MATNSRKFLESLWDFFCSLKLAMFILISLAIVSIIGTVIPQGSIPEEYLATISPAKNKLYQLFGFYDMYHSWWFILLLYLLTLNLICCSIKRLPRIWKIVTQPEKLMSNTLEASFSSVVTVSTKVEPALLKEKTEAFLQAEFAKPVATEVDGDYHLFAEKTPWCRFSVYIVHLSIIVIFIGAIIGTQFGFKGYVNIAEGESVDKVALSSGKEISLGYALRCEQFTVTNYPNGAPKEFKSILTVLEDGKPVTDYTNARVIVNDPLTYNGITFYQSSYGNAGNYYFTVSNFDGKNSQPLTLSSDSSATLPDGTSMHVLDSTDDVSEFAPEASGPGVLIETHSPQGESEKVTVYANNPELNIKHAKEHKHGYLLHYKGGEKKMYTGLQVAKDPGVWVVWLGCSMMIVGIYIAFFLSHRRIWVRIQNGKITIGGNANKHPGAFNLYFDTLAEKFKLHLSKEEQP